jgi:ribosomal protein S5
VGIEQVIGFAVGVASGTAAAFVRAAVEAMRAATIAAFRYRMCTLRIG